jgi:hypothetical protein
MTDRPPAAPAPTRTRPYYSVRAGRRDASLDLPVLRELFLATFEHFRQAGCFHEAFGYYCVDVPDLIAGTRGHDIGNFFLRRLRKPNIWPIHKERVSNYSEDDLFDLIELLFDEVSKPVKGSYHDYSDCGMHWETFNRGQGRKEFRAEINALLADYQGGWELSSDGEIRALGERGLRELLNTSLPANVDHANVQTRVEQAIRQFRSRHSSLDDRRQAVRELADVLEFLRPHVKEAFTRRSEDALFELANKFGIRHHNDRQETDYEQAIWLSWMFHIQLATIHAAVRTAVRESPATE